VPPTPDAAAELLSPIPYPPSPIPHSLFPLPVVRIALLFDQQRSEARIDALLDRGALVVGHVDGTREFDELDVETGIALLVADPVLDVPELAVDVAQAGPLGADVGR